MIYQPTAQHIKGEQRANEERTRIVQEVLKDWEEKKRLKLETKGKKKNHSTQTTT